MAYNKEAQAKYQKTGKKYFSLAFTRNKDQELISHLEAQESVSGYVRDLVNIDMANTDSVVKVYRYTVLLEFDRDEDRTVEFVGTPDLWEDMALGMGFGHGFPDRATLLKRRGCSMFQFRMEYGPDDVMYQPRNTLEGGVRFIVSYSDYENWDLVCFYGKLENGSRRILFTASK